MKKKKRKLNNYILESLFGAPPVTLATRRRANSALRSLSWVNNSAFVFCLNSWTLIRAAHIFHKFNQNIGFEHIQEQRWRKKEEQFTHFCSGDERRLWMLWNPRKEMAYLKEIRVYRLLLLFMLNLWTISLIRATWEANGLWAYVAKTYSGYTIFFSFEVRLHKFSCPIIFKNKIVLKLIKNIWDNKH